MPTIGMASVGSLHESDSTPLKGEGVQNALLHHTSVENRCTDHRLVWWQRQPVGRPIATGRKSSTTRAMPDQYATNCAASAHAMPKS